MQKTQLAVSMEMEQECPSVPVAHDFEEIGTLFDDIEELEDIREGLNLVDQKLAQTDVPEYDNQIHTMIYATLESYLSRVGLEDLLEHGQVIVSTEEVDESNPKAPGMNKIAQGPKSGALSSTAKAAYHYTEDVANVAAGTAKAAKKGVDKVRNTEAYAKAKEITKKALVAVSKKIRDASEKALKKFTDAIAQMGDYGDKLLNKAEEAQSLVKSLGNQSEQSEITIHGAHKLQYKGKVDPKSVETGLSQTHKLLDAMTGPYKDTLLKELEAMVDAFLGDASEKEFSHLQNPNDIKKAHKEIGDAFNDRAVDVLQKALADIPDHSLISGDYMVIARKKINTDTVFTAFTAKRPFLSNSDRKALNSKQTTATPDKKQLEAILKDVSAMGEILRDRADDLINHYKNYQKELKESYEKQSAGSKDDHNDPVTSWVVNKNGGDKILKTLKWYHKPITESMRTAHSVSRSALTYVDKAASAYA